MKWLAMIAAWLLGAQAQAADVTVSWTFATNNVDGTALTDLAGAKIYYGVASSNYVKIVDVPGVAPGAVGHCIVTGLVSGLTYYFNGTAYNTSALESDFAAEVSKKAKTKPGRLQKIALGGL